MQYLDDDFVINNNKIYEIVFGFCKNKNYYLLQEIETGSYIFIKHYEITKAREIVLSVRQHNYQIHFVVLL